MHFAPRIIMLHSHGHSTVSSTITVTVWLCACTGLYANCCGDSFFVCLAVCNLIKLCWSVCVSLNLLLNTLLNICHVTFFSWSSRHPLYNNLASSESFRTAILIWSYSSHFSIQAAPSVLVKNSSIGTPESKPDHFGIKETDERSLGLWVFLQTKTPSAAEFQPWILLILHVVVLPPF